MRIIKDTTQDYSEAAKVLKDNFIVQAFVKLQKLLNVYKGNISVTVSVLGNEIFLSFDKERKKFEFKVNGVMITPKSRISSFKDISAASLLQDIVTADLNGTVSINRKNTLQQEVREIKPVNLKKLNLNFPSSLFSKLQKSREGELQRDVTTTVGMKNVLTSSEFKRLTSRKDVASNYTQLGDFYVKNNAKTFALNDAPSIEGAIARTPGAYEFYENAMEHPRQCSYFLYFDDLYKVDFKGELSVIGKNKRN